MKRIISLFMSALIIINILPISISAEEAELDTPVVTVTVSNSDEPELKLEYDKIKGADIYYIYRRDTKNGSLKLYAKTKKTKFYDDDIEKDNVYYYKVKALAVDDEEIIAKSKSSKTADGAVLSVKTPFLSSEIISHTKVKLCWNEAENADRYYIYCSKEANGEYECIGYTTKKYHTFKNYDGSEANYYKIRAAKLLDGEVYKADFSHIVCIPKMDKKDSWNLILVNKDNPVPEGYIDNVTLIRNKDNNFTVDSRCYDALLQMLNDCRKAGLRPFVCSSYRTVEKQQELFDNEIAIFRSWGYTANAAYTLAARQVALPGTSEHHTGLAVDIVDKNNQILDSNQEKTAVQRWLMENSYKYGFILRYPNNKSDITGIIYEPWHYRYVGKEDALKIYKSGLCLEEYLQ